MDFQEAERRYAELKRQFDAGAIGVEDFNAERQRLMMQDDEGQWWCRSPNGEEWHYYDGSAWVPGTPPGYREATMDFQEAERRYAELKRQFDAGAIGVEDFNAERQRLMMQDDEGQWWCRSPNGEEWHYYDGSAWVPGTPPGYREATPGPTNLPAQTVSPSHPEGAENGEKGRQRVPPWIAVAGLAGIALVGIALGWALVPYLRGEPAPDEQAQLEKRLDRVEVALEDRTALDTVFIHHATPENISRNSTYLDSPLTDGNPSAVLVVTQNYNPGGSTGKYNNHPIGVWYYPKRKKWAIFNQDRAAMPVGADFNVAVLKEPTQAG